MNWLTNLWATYNKGKLYDDLEEDATAFQVQYMKEKIRAANLAKQLSVVTKDYQTNNLIDQLNKAMEEKYPAATIKYRGRSLPFSNEEIWFPVNCLITPYDPYIIQDLRKWGLYQTGENYETLIPKIYKRIRLHYYKYTVDKTVWGRNEVWELPFEMRAKGFKVGFDCDSWSQLQISYYIAAGAPYSLVRGVCGDTKIGGHSTVYIYSLESTKWHHLNSTYGAVLHDKVSDYRASDQEDVIGVTKVWFSYDWKRCYYDFKNLKKAKELSGFKILRLDTKT